MTSKRFGLLHLAPNALQLHLPGNVCKNLYVAHSSIQFLLKKIALLKKFCAVSRVTLNFLQKIGTNQCSTHRHVIGTNWLRFAWFLIERGTEMVLWKVCSAPVEMFTNRGEASPRKCALWVDSGWARSSLCSVNSCFPECVKDEVLALLTLMAATLLLADYNGSIKSGDLTLPLIYSQWL